MSRYMNNIVYILLIFKALNIYFINGQVSFNQIGCTFDTPNNFCDWDPMSNNSGFTQWVFKSNNAKSVTFNGPLTTFNNIGSFIQIYNPNHTTSVNMNGALQSPLIQPTNDQMCFSFYYYIHGVNVDKLQLHLINTNNTDIKIWSRRYPAGDMWHKYMINIPPQSTPFKLKFAIWSDSGAIALDEFASFSGECPISSVCDFESGSCGWTPTIGGKYDFKLTQAIDSAYQSINNYDHTTETNQGYFMESTNGVMNSTTTLVRQYKSAEFGEKVHCLHFWYSMHVSNQNKVVVTLESNNISKNAWESNNLFPKHVWHRASVTLQLNTMERIIIRATYLGVGITHIEIDDISLNNFECPPVISCNFNQDLCGWTRDITLGWIWDLGFGRVEHGNVMKYTNPPIHRTANNGMYLYSDFSSLTSAIKSTMKLNSEYLTSTPASCLKFYYQAVTFNDTTSSFKVAILDNAANILSILWSYSRMIDPDANNTVKDWKQVYINIPVHSSAFSISFQVTTTSPSTMIVLDDISFTPGFCF